MSADPVRAIADAVLYEGYLLWPYRRSAIKNQQRFTFGCVYPGRFAVAGGDRSQITMECLLEAGERSTVELSVRFLQLVARQPMRASATGLEPVDELWDGGERHLAWQEAVEREASTGALGIPELVAGRSVRVELPAAKAVEDLGEEGALVRSSRSVHGVLDVTGSILRDGVMRLSVRFANRGRWRGLDRPEALRRAFLSTHLVASARDAAFFSLTDPPDDLRAEAEACRNEGVWPVLVGEEPRRDTVLGSPIILSDYPAVAPESPGDLFDGAEIDALLIHSIRGMTNAEREEARATDPRVRALVDRSLDLPPERMIDLYGAVREMRRLDDA